MDDRDLVVVGGGVAGIRVAEAQVGSTLLLEGSSRLGGRVHTSATQGVQYERGAWRVSPTHTRALDWIGREWLENAPTLPPSVHVPSQETPHAGLTTWDVHALESGSVYDADRLDVDTGYTDQTHSAHGSEPYEAEGERFLVAPQGLTAAVHRHVQALGDHVEVRTNCRVTDVKPSADGYRVTVRERREDGFREWSVRARRLVLCVPPGAMLSWGIAADMRSVLHAVQGGSLNHVYAHDPTHERGTHELHPLLGQTVSSQYAESDWYQASYSGGRTADLWHHLRLSRPVDWWTVMRRLLPPGFGGDRARMHYWPVAYHRWRAVPAFDLQKAVRRCVSPNPWRLPQVFLAGEAFSSHQAWMEGALQTAEMVIRLLEREEAPPREPRDRPKRWVKVEGWYIDVDDFMKGHPGGEGALRNHLGEEVDSLLDHVGHSPHAWACVHSLKWGEAS